MAKLGRPKEQFRIPIDIRVLPGTLLKIDAQVRKGRREGNRAMASRGKVVDSCFKPKGKR